MEHNKSMKNRFVRAFITMCVGLSSKPNKTHSIRVVLFENPGEKTLETKTSMTVSYNVSLYWRVSLISTPLGGGGEGGCRLPLGG